ncbi:MAG: hypothetical protein WEC84_03310 [Candidatus Andersenbacteria bacterium]
MAENLHVRPLGWVARLADTLMIPLMYLASGTIKESPQQTHLWNNTKLSSEEIRHLSRETMAHCSGDPTAVSRYICGIPVFHIPILGGWRMYVVLEPVEHDQEWHVGWTAEDTQGVSRVAIRGPVRTLIGPGDASFFGVTVEGEQVPIRHVATGYIWKHGPYARLPLL